MRLRRQSIYLKIFGVSLLVLIPPLLLSKVHLQYSLLLISPAFLLIALIVWRLVRPLRKLRDQVRLREQSAAFMKPISLQRDDEFEDLAQSFNLLLSKLDQRQKQNEAFVADLAHEFKNPVAAMRSAAEQLDKPGPLDAERKQKLAKIMLRSTAQLNSLVSDFLSLARAEAGLHDQERETFDFVALGRALIDEVKQDPRFELKVCCLETKQEHLAFKGVASQIEITLRNLLINAASFAGKDGRVCLRIRNDLEYLYFSVEDSGPGIPEQDRAHIFDRFFSRRSAKQGKSQGSGLGLAMCKAIIEAHGGQISLADNETGHTEFIGKLPFFANIKRQDEPK